MPFPSFLPASDKQYLPRPKLEKEVWRALGLGRTVIISGPRRSGKTTLLMNIRREAQEHPDLWGAAGRGKVLFLDGQRPGAEHDLIKLLTDLLPEMQRPADTRLIRSGNLADELVVQHIQSLLDRLAGLDQEILLLIDEVDLPLQWDTPDLWRKVLDCIFRHDALCVVATADAFNLDAIRQHVPPRKFTSIEMPTWSEQEIRELIERMEIERFDDETRSAISRMLAPAWPIEIVLVLRHVAEEGVPGKIELESILDDRDVVTYGTGVVDRALDRLGREDSRVAVRLLSAIADPDAVHGNRIDPERSAKGDNLGKLMPIVRKLIEAGIVKTQGKLIVAATPAMLHALRSVLGL